MIGDELPSSKSRIAPDVLEALEIAGQKSRRRGDLEDPLLAVIIELNARFPGGEQTARMLLIRALELEGVVRALRDQGRAAIVEAWEGVEFSGDTFPLPEDRVSLINSLQTDRFLFARLKKEEILAVAALQARLPGSRPAALVYKIWLDEALSPLVFVSSRTIKCDAARAAFMSAGRDIVWAVADTGVARHEHFLRHKNLELPEGLEHRDFTLGDSHSLQQAREGALVDTDGHGTHVAGIIAGETRAGEVVDEKDPASPTLGQVEITPAEDSEAVDLIAGVAPHCKIMSLKVLEKGRENGGDTSRILAAIGHIQSLNAYGRRIRVHGLNISLGYDFKPLNFAAGQSPLCAEVDRLVKCGVVVVVAAGNGGGGIVRLEGGESAKAAHLSTIADPGNSEMAITVGSTHRDRPHTYGVSFFSAKGPTIDGRMKPDLVAPGERIVSCDATGSRDGGKVPFRSLSGTSMAAPHVSGAIAAFLSVRGEFRGQPERVKRLFLDNATDLGRRPEFQGRGLIDLMRTLQAV